MLRKFDHLRRPDLSATSEINEKFYRSVAQIRNPVCFLSPGRCEMQGQFPIFQPGPVLSLRFRSQTRSLTLLVLLNDRLVDLSPFGATFDKLRPSLVESFELAEPGSESVMSHYRSPNGACIRKCLEILIERAGLTQRPRITHNLRASMS